MEAYSQKASPQREPQVSQTPVSLPPMDFLSAQQEQNVFEEPPNFNEVAPELSFEESYIEETVTPEENYLQEFNEPLQHTSQEFEFSEKGEVEESDEEFFFDSESTTEGSLNIVQTDTSAVSGLTKCVKCGATEIALNIDTGNLRCQFCQHEWGTESLEELGLDTDIEVIEGMVYGSGAQDIIPSTDTVLTFKCSSCGAEIIVDTDESMQSRCHWCRNVLSVNEQIPNGAVPDVILPFKLQKEEAIELIKEFVSKRKFFANRTFLKEFNPENVMGVYLPYLVIDTVANIDLSGEGQVETDRYEVRVGTDSKGRAQYETRYAADTYSVHWNFDLLVKHLTIESSSTRLDQDVTKNTNNIINSIMPFDVENAVKYDANYLSGFSSEKRDTNIEMLEEFVKTQNQDLARHSVVNEVNQKYDRGVRWEKEEIETHGQRWYSAYFPVWLYSYQEVKKNGEKFLHYVAVNARTGETMGSVPLNNKKLLFISAIVEVIGVAAFIMLVILGVFS